MLIIKNESDCFTNIRYDLSFISWILFLNPLNNESFLFTVSVYSFTLCI